MMNIFVERRMNKFGVEKVKKVLIKKGEVEG